MNDNPILADLNPEQLQAVTHKDGPLLILAGAGSGKTRTLTRRIAYLIRERAVLPDHILAVTFTNKAAQEMKNRLAELVEESQSLKWVGTFHAMFLRMLRMHHDRLSIRDGFVIYDADEQEALIKRILKAMGREKESARQYLSYIEDIKNRGLIEPPEPDSPKKEDMNKVFMEYQRALSEANALDFGDILCQALRLLKECEDIRRFYATMFEHILVDEFQDTNLVQRDLLLLLTGPKRNVCVVGDDDQAIYSWRGARVENILEFTTLFPDATVITLKNNYRSLSPILNAARHVINFNKYRHKKDLTPIRGGGPKLILYQAFSELDEARFVVRQIRRLKNRYPLSHIAVFYRTNAQSRVFEDQLRTHSIPYRVVGGIKFYSRKEIKNCIAYLRLLQNPNDDLALERIVDVPPRGIGQATIEKAKMIARENNESLLVGLARVADQSFPKLAKKISSFIDMMMNLAEIARTEDVVHVVRLMLEKTGYLDYLKMDDSLEGQERVENLEALIASVQDFVETTGLHDLKSFLDGVSLVQPTDEPEKEAVNLMTVHSAKGLEFDCVFVCGLEEELFPHVNSMGNQYSLEEERRLMYVAMTRARDILYLTYSATRTKIRGIIRTIPSRFLKEIPKSEIEVI